MLVALLVLGLVLLVVGGEVLVRGASGVARAAGLSPLVVGLTVVAAATSAPELAVTLVATLDGAPGLAVGNVVGSNIANVLLVVGVSAVLLPLLVGRQVLRVDLPVVVAVSVLTLVLALDGTVGRVDGLVLLLVVVAHTTRAVLVSRRQERAGRRAAPSGGEDAGAVRAPAGRGRLLRDVVLVAVGVALLVAGSQALVSAASTVARELGVSDLVVGLTVVAVGTSLPELATSVVAVVRGQRDLAVGNVVGSCIFNVGAVLGLTGLLSPGGVPVESSARAVDLPVMVGSAALLWVLALCAADLSRRDGALLLGAYATYVGYLVVDAAGSAVREDYVRTAAAVGAVVAVVLVVALVREVRRHRGDHGQGPGRAGGAERATSSA